MNPAPGRPKPGSGPSAGSAAANAAGVGAP
jgi:hypothetical protein